jgi:hypothetical protein
MPPTVRLHTVIVVPARLHISRSGRTDLVADLFIPLRLCTGEVLCSSLGLSK